MNRRPMIAVLLLTAWTAKPIAAQSCSAYASSLVFGTYSGTVVNVTGTVTVTCTVGTPYHIGLNAGNTPGATITNRLMFGGNGGQNKLGYQLFNNASRTINWGNSAATNWVSGTGTGGAQPYTIYATMPAGEISPEGSYTDTITASITGSFTTATAQFSVTSTYTPICMLAATNLNFGTYTESLVNAVSSITVVCPSGVSYAVGLSAGTAPGATVSNRSMTGSNGALLHYALFRDAGHTLNWGNTVGVDTQPGTGNAVGQILTVYGQLPSGQTILTGAYTDTITATVTF